MKQRIPAAFRALLLLTGMLLFCGSLSGCVPRSMTAYSYSGSVTVTLGMGTRAPLSAGRTVPVSVNVTGDYAAEGNSVTVTVPANGGDFYCYQRTLSDSSDQQVIFTVQVSENSSQMVVEVTDEGGSVIYSRTCSYQFSSMEGKAGEVVIGMIGISDSNIWNFSYASGDSHIAVRTVEIKPDNLLADPKAYDQYNLLVLSADAVRQLTGEQKDGLCSWMGKGGIILLLGTRQTAGELGASTNIRLKSSEFADGASVTGYAADRGLLWLMVSQTFEREYSETEQIILLDILLDGSVEQAALQTQSSEKMDSVLIDAMGSQESITEVADIRVYYLIFIVYLVFALPGMWLFLRKKDRLYWFRLFVCLLACAVSGLIWTAGSKTRFSDPFLHSISLYDYSGETVRRMTCFSVQAPFNHGYEISLQPGCVVEPMQSGESWSQTVFHQYQRHTAHLEQSQEEISLRMDNLIAFAPRYFRLLTEEASDGKITGEIDWMSEEIDGTFTNELGCDLRQAVIFACDQVFLLEQWKAGETVNLIRACEEGTCQSVSADQFLEDSYRRPDGWDSQYSELYKQMLRMESALTYRNVFVMGKTDMEGPVQKNTGYEQSGVSFALTRIQM